MHEKIKEYLDEQRSQLEAQKNYFAEREVEIDQVLADLETAVGEHFTLALDYRSVNIRASGNAKTLSKIFHVLRKHGLEPNERPKEKSSTFSSHFYGENNLHFWLYFTSTSCRIVHRGTKWVEQSVYETVCEDEQVEAQTLAAIPPSKLEVNEEDRIPF